MSLGADTGKTPACDPGRGGRGQQGCGAWCVHDDGCESQHKTVTMMNTDN